MRAIEVVMVLVAVTSARAILHSAGSGFNRETTLCEDTNEMCGCDPARETMRCSCPNKGEKLHLRNATIPVTLRNLIVNHCSHVLVSSDALNSLSYLARVEISNVDVLQLEERALFWEPHRLVYGREERTWVHENFPDENRDVQFYLSNVSNAQFPRFSFGGHVEEIVMDNVRVSRFESYAVANTYNVIRTLKLERCSIDYIAFQAFRKVLIEELIISKNRIVKMESSAFKEVLVKNSFRFEHNYVDMMASSALGLIGPVKIDVKGNRIQVCHGDAFRIFSRGTVLISDNTFYSIRAGALRGFKPYEPQFYPTPKPSHQDDQVGDYPQLLPEPWEDKERPHEMMLNNNTLMEFENGALSVNRGYRVAYDRVQLNKECDCDGISLLAADLVGLQTGINGFSVLSAQNTSSLHRALWCKQSRSNQPTSLSAYESQHCQGGVLSSGWSILIIVAASILFVMLLVGLAVILWCSYRRNKLQIVKPEKKVYQQTEFKVVYEPVTELQLQNLPTPKTVQVPPEMRPLRPVTEEEPLEEVQETRTEVIPYATVQIVNGSKETVYENCAAEGQPQVIYEEIQPAERRVTFASRTETAAPREFLESDII
ncbi:uncharacterized protein LOC132193041 [Neocloeon triangulifer]|uniref:uncharacterized protein LOC132193041 n=1 Tax=Neocloeon triangulifer TaxID=2078957 RepID=UPI00286FAE6D|nr:uncharacterized protein LOC132193041 [Neocloeon triangulifer]